MNSIRYYLMMATVESNLLLVAVELIGCLIVTALCPFVPSLRSELKRDVDDIASASINLRDDVEKEL